MPRTHVPTVLSALALVAVCAATAGDYQLIDLNIHTYARHRMSGDGRYLIYHTGDRLTRLDLFQGTTQTSSPLNASWSFEVSTDGDLVAFQRNDVSLYRFSTDTVEVLLPDMGVESLTLSGNGRRIAFRSSMDRGANPDGSDEWFILDVPSGTITQITDSQPMPVNLSSLPGSFNEDGTRFAFNDDFGTDVPFLGFWEEGVGTRNLDTAGVGYETVTLDGAGTFLCFLSGGDITGENPEHFGEIFGYDLLTDTFTQLTHATTFPFAFAERMGLSRDGRLIYFVSTGNYTGSDPGTLLWALDRAGTVTPVSDARGTEVFTDTTGGRTLFWRSTPGDSLFLAVGGGPSVPTLGRAGLVVLSLLLALTGLVALRRKAA